MSGVPGRLSGPVLARVAGLPADALDIVGPPTRDLLDELARAGDELERLAPRLIDVLFDLVPRLDDDVPLRRRVLAGKRAVNKLGALPWDDGTAARAHARLAPEDGTLLDAWIRLTGGRAGLLAKLGSQLAVDRAAALERLRGSLDDPSFARSLALTAPDWLRYGRRDSARDRQTLYSYVSRAAVKTSPLSGLTTVGLAGTAGLGRARSRTTATLAHRALWLLAHDEQTAGLLRYRAAPIVPGGPAAPAGLLLHSEVSTAEGIIWRQDRVVEADHARRWLDPLGAQDRALDEILASIGGARPFTRFVRLLDSGLLHPVPPWRRGEEPFGALMALAARAPGGQAAEAPGAPAARIGAGALSSARDLGSRACREGVKGRLNAAQAVGELARAWSERPGGLIYEDRETDADLPDPCAFTPVREDLTALSARMRPWVFRSHVYDLLLNRFVAEYGRGGHCRDPLGFLMRIATDGDSHTPLEQAVGMDLRSRAAPGERAWLPVGPTSAPPGAALLVQFEADDWADVADGRHRMVVNNFSYGSGGLFTRFRELLGEDLRTRLAGHVAACWPGASHRELVVWTECNTVQAECAGLLPPLLVPGEPDAPGGLRLEATVLAHDRDTDTLSLLEPGGAPIGLAYLGLIPQHLLQSYVRLLAVLADPWVNAAPYSDYTLTRYDLLSHCGEDVVALPRETHGRVVTRRASWIAPVRALPLPEPGRDEAALASLAHRFRRVHGMPEEVFVHQLGATTMRMGGERKPLWVSLSSPLSLDTLAQWLRPETGHVRIVEALPERHLHPQRDAAGRRRATEHAVLLHWPRQGS
ncbi:hypothetical protein OHA25_49645 [Nonomuraea sp. NBC_00507]|uniref:hypothetical protein n=1 Tax=Nonomuraea sp. NBC_00507 TaxID=2976002 RepID=UPI002E16D8C9